jgi:hypothetical protein
MFVMPNCSRIMQERDCFKLQRLVAGPGTRPRCAGSSLGSERRARARRGRDARRVTRPPRAVCPRFQLLIGIRSPPPNSDHFSRWKFAASVLEDHRVSARPRPRAASARVRFWSDGENSSDSTAGKPASWSKSKRSLQMVRIVNKDGGAFREPPYTPEEERDFYRAMAGGPKVVLHAPRPVPTVVKSKSPKSRRRRPAK